MQRFSIVLIAQIVLAGSALADPTGIWLVSKGYARIRIDTCNGSFWGAVVWEQRAGGVDSNNPDPTKRTRPTLGLPVLLDMKQTEQNKWAGQIYNSEDGKTYSSHISMGGPDVLEVRGCVMGIFCGGENWTRVTDQPQTGPGATPGTLPNTSGTPRTQATPAKPTGSSTSGPASQQKPNVAARPSGNANDPVDLETASTEDFCSMVLNGPRAPH